MNQRTVVATPIIGLLGIAFVVLKLCGVIDWSWWLVTAPFWGLFAVMIAVFLVVCFFATILKAVLTGWEKAEKAIAERAKAR